MKESLDLLKQLNIDKTKNIVVATSGGPDSMALLHMLKNNNYNVICAHVNHNLRRVSDDEYIFVQDYCKKNNIIFEGMKIDGYKNNKFTESEARKKRYDFFEKILIKYNTDILLTAHHGDDLIETILMRIIRGSNLDGIKGFSKISKFKNFKIIRPLIFYTKDEIQTYVEKNNIPYVVDETNKSKKYTRNRIRLDILPLLKKETNNVHRKFLNFSEELEENNQYIKEKVEELKKENFKDNTINLKLFNKNNKYIKKKELESVLLDIYSDNINVINKKHIENILKITEYNKNSEIDLPNNIKVIKSYNNLKFINNKDKLKKYKYIFKDSVEIDEYGIIKTIEDTKEKSNYVIKLNSNEISLPLIIRTMEDNDYMEVKNLNGRKKINKIFIDEKIEKDLRKTYPILTDSNNNILWIPGIKKSKFYDIIIKYTKKEKNYEEK